MPALNVPDIKLLLRLQLLFLLLLMLMLMQVLFCQASMGALHTKFLTPQRPSQLRFWGRASANLCRWTLSHLVRWWKQPQTCLALQHPPAHQALALTHSQQQHPRTPPQASQPPQAREATRLLEVVQPPTSLEAGAADRLCVVCSIRWLSGPWMHSCPCLAKSASAKDHIML